MNRYIDSGVQAVVVAASDVKGGDLVAVAAGKIYGIAHLDIPAGTEGVVDLRGKFAIGLADGASFALGDKVYANDGKAATSGDLIGIAAKASANGEVEVYFDGLAAGMGDADESDSQ